MRNFWPQSKVIRVLFARRRPATRWLGCTLSLASLTALGSLAALGSVLPLPAAAAVLQVAVAANFAAPIQPLATAFERQTGHRLVVSLGSSGKFYAQVRQGAPFQVLLSADTATPQQLEQEGLTVAGSRFNYATGRLVLWSAQPGLVDAQGEILKNQTLQPQDRLAIAAPERAPYGAAALEVLQRTGTLAAHQRRLVHGESVAQAYQFVATGNARLGFVALSQVMRDGRMAAGSAWLVPTDLHSPLQQEAVLIKAPLAKANPEVRAAAQALLDFLKSEAGRSIMRRYGYTF